MSKCICTGFQRFGHTIFHYLFIWADPHVGQPTRLGKPSYILPTGRLVPSRSSWAVMGMSPQVLIPPTPSIRPARATTNVYFITHDLRTSYFFPFICLQRQTGTAQQPSFAASLFIDTASQVEVALERWQYSSTLWCSCKESYHTTTRGSSLGMHTHPKSPNKKAFAQKSEPLLFVRSCSWCAIDVYRWTDDGVAARRRDIYMVPFI